MSRAQAIKAFVIAEFIPDVSPDELADDYDLLSDGVIDSLGLLKLIAWVENEFGVVIDDTALAPDNFRSVRAIDGFVGSRSSVEVAGG